MEALQASSSKMEEAEKEYKDKEEDVNAQARRVLLLEEEVRTIQHKIPIAIESKRFVGVEKYICMFGWWTKGVRVVTEMPAMQKS